MVRDENAYAHTLTLARTRRPLRHPCTVLHLKLKQSQLWCIQTTSLVFFSCTIGVGEAQLHHSENTHTYIQYLQCPYQGQTFMLLHVQGLFIQISKKSFPGSTLIL